MTSVVVIDPIQLAALISDACTAAVERALAAQRKPAVTWLSVRDGMQRYGISRREWVRLCERGTLRATQRVTRGAKLAWYVTLADADRHFKGRNSA